MRGVIFGGACIRRGLSTEGNLPFLLCFTLYLRAISKYKRLGRASLEGLYLEGLINGGAYFRNFAVFLFQPNNVLPL